MAVDAAEVSGATVRLTLVVELGALNRLSVRPGTAPVTVFVALEMLIPFTVREAFLPVTAVAKAKLVPVEVAVKFPALPEVLLVIARRAPEASVMMLAVTPSPAALTAASRSVNVFTPVPVVIVAVVPLLLVMVKLSAGTAVAAVAIVVEVKEAVLARLFTTTVVFPAAVPDAAVAVTTPLLEDATELAANGPVKLLSDCISLSRLVVAVWMLVKSEVWLWSVVISAFQIFSGLSAAVTAEFTAAVTSSPGVDAPIAASRIVLMSIAFAELDDPSSEFNAEDELINGMPSLRPESHSHTGEDRAV